MSEWKLAMLLALPFMQRGAKLRTWFALMGASLAAMAFPPLTVGAYIAIDIAAGAIVLARPAGEVQRLIGRCFVLMVGFHLGFALNLALGPVEGADLFYYQANTATGWLQFAILLGWGLWDAGKALVGVADRRRIARAEILARAADR